MINQDYILLIMNCKKYKEKAEYQKNTWLKSLPSYIKYYHIIGDESLDCEYKFDEDNSILYLNVPDDYNSLPKKVIQSYKVIHEMYNYKYIFKTDDDQKLLNNKFFDILKNVIENKKPQIHYGGNIVNVNQAYISKYYLIHSELPKNIVLQPTKYSSGRFYFLSCSAIKHLLEKKENIEKEYFEDYAIGFNLDNFYKTNILNLKTNEYFKDINVNII